MPITNYATLQTAVGAWLQRTDLGEQIPDFISIAEKHLSADLEAREMEVRLPLSLSNSTQYLTLPDDLLEVRRVTISGDPATVLKYVTPDQIASDFPSSFAGRPRLFTVIGNEIQIAPISDGSYSGELVYRQAIPSLSDSRATNWLLVKYPNAYLFASLMAAQFYVEDENKFQMIQGAYQEAISNINSVDWYSGSTMVVRAL